VRERGREIEREREAERESESEGEMSVFKNAVIITGKDKI
jgi:hypothetical protein